MTYETTRDRLETYFDRTAARTWEALTSDVPVSRIRQTVREGRDAMRAELLSQLPRDLTGTRVLDAGCGTGQMSVALAERGAEVIAVDISPSLLDVARDRTPVRLQPRIDYRAGEMLDTAHGRFDAIVAMDSLIHYNAADIAKALARLGVRTSGPIAFTLAPRTALLTLMWWTGQLFPRSDRAPAIRPHRTEIIGSTLKTFGSSLTLHQKKRINRGFYISQAVVAC